MHRRRPLAGAAPDAVSIAEKAGRTRGRRWRADPVRDPGRRPELDGVPVQLRLVAGTIVALGVFLRTELGLALRATGDNPRMATAQGVDVGMKLVLVYALSNGCIGVSGALFAQYSGSRTSSSGSA